MGMAEGRSPEGAGGSWHRAYRATQSGGSSDCPATEVLAAMAIGEVRGSRRRALGDHVVACRPCTDRYRALRELHAEAGALDLAPAGRDATRRYLAAAAALALGAALSIGLWLSGGPGSDPSGHRGGIEVVDEAQPPDGSVLHAGPRTLTWPASPDADRYRVVLYDAESTPVWESPDSTEPEIELPPDVADRLIPGKAYYWRVFTLRGLEERRSPVRKFTLEP